MEKSVRPKLRPFATADTARSVVELTITVVGYILSVYAVYLSYIAEIWYAYGLLSILLCLFIVKAFVLFHDCTHGSMFNSETANRWVGRCLSLPFGVPFTAWKNEHDYHHDHITNLDTKEFGEVPLQTVEEFRALSPLMQKIYIVYRHPLVYIFFAPVIYFLIRCRFPAMPGRDNFWSVMLTNLAILAVFIPAVYYFGFWTIVIVLGPATYAAGIIGTTLFYLQHDYPGVHWFTNETWDHEQASLEGASLIVLPKPLEWFTHAIGFHHIHHLNSKIPGYKLRDCYEHIPELQQTRPLTWSDVIEAFRLKFWSKEKNALIHLSELKSVKS